MVVLLTSSWQAAGHEESRLCQSPKFGYLFGPHCLLCLHGTTSSVVHDTTFPVICYKVQPPQTTDHPMARHTDLSGFNFLE
jgi:hypothetical protein